MPDAKALQPHGPGSLLLDAKQLARELAVSVATVYRMKDSGRLGPKPIRLSGGTVRWELAEIIAWINTRKSDGTLPDHNEWQAIHRPAVHAEKSR